MSFTPLEINRETVLNAAQVSKHGIDSNGKSSLPYYADSIFSVIYHDPSRISSGDPLNPTIRYTDPKWTVTRIL